MLVSPQQVRRARSLRRSNTPAEAKLWPALRNRGLSGAKARRHVPCGPWILDFAFWTEKLAVEIDGVLATIAAALGPHPGPLPKGEGEKEREGYVPLARD